MLEGRVLSQKSDIACLKTSKSKFDIHNVPMLLPSFVFVRVFVVKFKKKLFFQNCQILKAIQTFDRVTFNDCFGDCKKCGFKLQFNANVMSFSDKVCRRCLKTKVHLFKFKEYFDLYNHLDSDLAVFTMSYEDLCEFRSKLENEEDFSVLFHETIILHHKKLLKKRNDTLNSVLELKEEFERKCFMDFNINHKQAIELLIKQGVLMKVCDKVVLKHVIQRIRPDFTAVTFDKDSIFLRNVHVYYGYSVIDKTFLMENLLERMKKKEVVLVTFQCYHRLKDPRILYTSDLKTEIDSRRTNFKRIYVIV